MIKFSLRTSYNKKQFLFVIVMLLLADLAVAAKAISPQKQNPSSGHIGRDIPADLAWVTLFTDRIRKNPQGFWEVELFAGIEMIYIPAGDFLMGAPREEVGWEDGESPVHRVYIKGIMIGKYEVTQGIWRSVMEGGVAHPGEKDLPKGNVSYDDIQKFLLALKIKSGFAFRLPTEAEWEKCCRGGSAGPDYGPINEISWNAQNSGDKIHPVGRKRPNNFGIYDMLGNVWEWCSDWYGASYYMKSPYLNPAGPEKGKLRVMRGGGFRHSGHYLRSAHRNDQYPDISKPQYGYGFRLVLDLELR